MSYHFRKPFLCYRLDNNGFRPGLESSLSFKDDGRAHLALDRLFGSSVVEPPGNLPPLRILPLPHLVSSSCKWDTGFGRSRRAGGLMEKGPKFTQLTCNYKCAGWMCGQASNYVLFIFNKTKIKIYTRCLT